MTTNKTLNQEIYNKNYSGKECDLKTNNKYDQELINIRLNYLNDYSTNKVVADLCCGTGSYLKVIKDQVKHIFGIDFSSNMLSFLKTSLNKNDLKKVTLLEEDAGKISLKTNSIDLLFAYTSLYHIPHQDKVLKEISRVLKKNGVCILEFGNINSLNTIVSEEQHKTEGWAKPYHITISEMKKLLKDNDLKPFEWRSFQISPMYGAPRKYRYLLPILSNRWKVIMSIKLGKKILDEWISSLPILRNIAFRHIIVSKKL